MRISPLILDKDALKLHEAKYGDLKSIKIYSWHVLYKAKSTNTLLSRQF